MLWKGIQFLLRRVTVVMDEEKTGKCLGQVEHIFGPLWHRKSVAVNHGHGGDSNTCTLVVILNIAEIYFTLYRQQYTN